MKNWQSCGNMQSSYLLLLDDKLKILSHFANQTFQSNSDYEVFRNLCTYCVPFIKRTPFLRPLLDSWKKSLQDYQQRCKKAEKGVIELVTNAYVLVKERLHSKHLYEDELIADKLLSIEKILDGREGVSLQPYYEVANERMQDLFKLLLSREEKEILIDLVPLLYASEKISNTSKTYSGSFSIAISYLYALKQKQSRDNFHDAWVIWEKLHLAHWCWMHGEDFFHKQELNYDSIKDCKRSGFLLELHANYCDMHTIRERPRKSSESSFFSQARFKKYLESLLNHILLFQGDLKVETSKENKISALGLQLNQNFLYLFVEWVKEKEISWHLLHTFQEDSVQLKILRTFFSSEKNKTVSLKESSSGNNSTKFLERIGLIKEFKSIFIEKTSTYSVSFRGKYIELASLSSVNQPQLIQQIDKLPITRDPS